MRSIYTDGHSLDVSDREAERLAELVEPHPSAGEGGFEPGDLRLRPSVEWSDVYAALGEGPR